MPEENVKVAVRVRPFNGREKDRNAQLIIDMQGATTTITDPSNSSDVKKFTFDYSYWSHDGCKDDGTGYFGPDTSHPHGKKFADQKKVYNELGQGVLNNAWEGYNSTLFAYGQTGSGKSWSMVGYGVNKGIVPLYCETLFKQTDEKKAAGAKEEYEVSFSMLEIYNEQVRDLLDSAPSKTGLKVRQHPKMGFYADGLKTVPVGSYTEIEQRIEEGTRNRTVASTKMNATSSRAHTIVGITFVQKSVNAAGEEMAKTAIVNLVDLAGSERADSTGATGDRLKEGAAINQSLSNLGNCIAALADRAGGKNTRVPYRDSVLTKLLKNALGGNSKTIMIAALSPADINYDETLSTLRYADRAKQIKTSAKVNEDPTAQLIRELQEENEKLKAMLAGKKLDTSELLAEGEEDEMTEEEKSALKKELEDEYKSMLEKNQKEMEEMQKSFEQKLAEAQGTGSYKDIAEINEKKKRLPHLYNLNSDPMLTGHIIHFIENDQETVIGNGKDKETDLTIRGGSIEDRHCVIREKDGVFTLETFPNARTLRNGKVVTDQTKTLKHNDRLLFGTTQFYVFCNPNDKEGAKNPSPDFEMAQAEIASKSGGFDMSSAKTRDDAVLQQDLIEVLPAVEEANSISEALGKKKRFDMVIVSPEARGALSGRTEVMVKMTQVDTKHEWMWSRRRFLDRRCIMAEMYDNYEDGDEWDLPQDKDPFYDDPKADFHIGSVKVWLQSISYLIESNEVLDITDFKGSSVGKLMVMVVPCDPKGKEYTEKDDKFVENPDVLLGKDIDFKIKIVNARGLPNRFTDVYCKYQVYLEENYTQTKPISNTTNPDFNHERVISLKGTPESVTFLKESAFIVQVWGKQKDEKPKGPIKKKSGMTVALHTVNTNQSKGLDPEKVKFMMEVATLRKRQEKMEAKLAHMRKMIAVAEEHQKRKVSTKLIKDIYHAPTNDQAEKCIALIPLEKDSDDEDEGGKGGGGGGGGVPVGIVPPLPSDDKRGQKGEKTTKEMQILLIRDGQHRDEGGDNNVIIEKDGRKKDGDKKDGGKMEGRMKGGEKKEKKHKHGQRKRHGSHSSTSSSSSDSDSDSSKKKKENPVKPVPAPRQSKPKKQKSSACVLL